MLVVVSGLGQPIQVAANSRLREAMQSPVLSGLVSLLASAFVLAIVTLSGLTGRGQLSGISRAPWWAWLGGVCGALSIVAGILALPRTSAASVITAAIFGQMVGSLIVDHFGWFNVEKVRIDSSRLIGAILLLLGALLIQRR